MTQSDPPTDFETPDRRDDVPAGPPSADDGSDPATEAWTNMRTLAERSLDEGIVLAYGLMFAVSTVAASILAFAVGAGLYGTAVSGADGEFSSMESFVSVGVLGTVGLCFLVGMVVWQTVLVGFQRPMRALLVDGPSAVDGAKDALHQAVSRFWSILGVSGLIGLVVWGGAATSFSVGLLSMSGAWESGVSPETIWPILLLGSGWLIVAAVVCFLFGPATYFAATRDFGIFDALATSYRFVLDHLVEMLLAWALFVGLNMAINMAVGTISAIPCCGAALSIPLQAIVGFFSALGGLIYWVGVYVTFENTGRSGR